MLKRPVAVRFWVVTVVPLSPKTRVGSVVAAYVTPGSAVVVTVVIVVPSAAVVWSRVTWNRPEAPVIVR